jgi:hypothetical protein
VELANDFFTVRNRCVYIKSDALTKIHTKSKSEIKNLIARVSTDMTNEFCQRELIKDKTGYLLSQDGFTVVSFYLQTEVPEAQERRKKVIEQMAFIKTMMQREELEKDDFLKRQQLRLLVSDIARKQKKPEAFVWYDFDKAWFKRTGVKLGQVVADLEQTRPEYLLSIGRMDDAISITYEMLEEKKKARLKKAG